MTKRNNAALAIGIILVIVAALVAIFNQSRRLIDEPAAPLDLIQPSDLEFEE